jgi:DinB superfamily
MLIRALKFFVWICLALMTTTAFAAPALGGAAGEYEKHFDARANLSIAVAQAMPAEQYGFKPHPESMTFGELMSHVAATNYQFCAGLKGVNPPSLPSPTDRDGVIKFLSDSFAYGSEIISNLTEQQRGARFSGRSNAWA